MEDDAWLIVCYAHSAALSVSREAIFVRNKYRVKFLKKDDLYLGGLP